MEIQCYSSKSARFHFTATVTDLLQPAMFITVAESRLLELEHILGLLKLEKSVRLFQ